MKPLVAWLLQAIRQSLKSREDDEVWIQCTIADECRRHVPQYDMPMTNMFLSCAVAVVVVYYYMYTVSLLLLCHSHDARLGL